MKILFAGGGTAGHITPALAIAEELKCQTKNPSFLFVGREGGRENRAIRQEGYPERLLKMEGFSERGIREKLRALRLLARSMAEAREIIKEFSPDVILGTGGYVSYPIVKMGERLGIPTFLHESNAVPGLVTRLLSHGKTHILLGGELSAYTFPKRTRVSIVGTPVRKAFYTVKREEARRRLGLTGECFIVSFGGSLGAEKMNEMIVKLILTSNHPNVRFLHGAGHRFYEKMRKDELTTLKNARIVPYIENMPTVLCAADIVICRSGASTVAELCALGAAAILIPSPNVTGNHQYYNAKRVEQRGGCVLLEEESAGAKDLEAVVDRLIKNETMRKRLRESIKSKEEKSPAERICELLTEAANRK